MPVQIAHERWVDVPGGRVWCQIVGDAGAIPLLTLHGGPGAGHDNLEPLARLAEERPVVFYDQLGCGHSDKPDDRSLWHIERYVAEISAVRAALGFDRIHLYGQSWGGMLAIEYMMSKPSGVVSLILSSAPASSRQFLDEIARLRATLPEELQATLRHYEAAGDYHNPEYERAVLAFLGPLFCRLEPFPDLIWRTTEIFNCNRTPYETLWGPNDFIITGTMKGWDRTNRLDEIAAPTLVLCGRHDEVTPACAETLQRGIPGAELCIFENCAHMAHLEEPEHYVQVVRDFLRRVEREG